MDMIHPPNISPQDWCDTSAFSTIFFSPFIFMGLTLLAEPTHFSTAEFVQRVDADFLLLLVVNLTLTCLLGKFKRSISILAAQLMLIRFFAEIEGFPAVSQR